MPENDGQPLFEKVMHTIGYLLDWPVTAFRENIWESYRSKHKHYYYHRRYNRVPTVDECAVDDQLCIFEADEQLKRDKKVDDSILSILRQRRIECEVYYQDQAHKHCGKLKEDYETAETNWFIKHGDLGFSPSALECYMKQKHRLIWERRHGEVGTGMKAQAEA